MAFNRSKRSSGGAAVEVIQITPPNKVYAGKEYYIGEGQVLLEDTDLRPVEYKGWLARTEKFWRGAGAAGASSRYGYHAATGLGGVGCVSYNANLDLVFSDWVRTDSPAKSGFVLTLVDKVTGQQIAYLAHHTDNGDLKASGFGVAVHIRANGDIAVIIAAVSGSTSARTFVVPVVADQFGAVTTGSVLTVASTGLINCSLDQSRKVIIGNSLIDMETFTVATISESGFSTLAAVWDGKYVILPSDLNLKILDTEANAIQTIVLGTALGNNLSACALWPGVILTYAPASYTINVLKITYGTPHTVTVVTAGNATWLPTNASTYALAGAVKLSPTSDEVCLAFSSAAQQGGAAPLAVSLSVTAAGVVTNLRKDSPLMRKINNGPLGWMPWYGYTHRKQALNKPYAWNTPVLGSFFVGNNAYKNSLVSQQSMVTANYPARAAETCGHLTYKVVPAMLAGELKVSYFGTPLLDAAAGVPVAFAAELMQYKGAAQPAGTLVGNTLVLNSLRCVKLRISGEAHEPAKLYSYVFDGRQNSEATAHPENPFASGTLPIESADNGATDFLYGSGINARFVLDAKRTGMSDIYNSNYLSGEFLSYPKAKGTLDLQTAHTMSGGSSGDNNIGATIYVVDCTGFKSYARNWRFKIKYAGGAIPGMGVRMQCRGLTAFMIDPGAAAAYTDGMWPMSCMMPKQLPVVGD